MNSSSLLMWLAIGGVAFTLDWGFFWLFYFAVSFLIVFGAMLLAVYKTTNEMKESSSVNLNGPLSPDNSRCQNTVISDDIEELRKERESLLNEEGSVTDIPEIDVQLNLILDYIIRDYVIPWSERLSATNDNAVLDETIKKKLQDAIGKFTEPFHSIDWVDYFTAQLVDDFVTHLHLYRVALGRVRMTKQNRGSLTVDAKLLEASFFEAEAELGEPHISRKAVSTNSNAEVYYFEGISDVILSQITLDSEIKCNTFRQLARTVLCWAVLSPSLEALSNPDLFNRTVMWLCRGTPFPIDIFHSVLRATTNLDELQAVLERINFEVSRCHAVDALMDSHDLREQLSSLDQLKQICDKRLMDLQMPRSRSSAFLFASNEYNFENRSKLPVSSFSAFGLSALSDSQENPGEDVESRPSNTSSVFTYSQPDQYLKNLEPKLLTLNDILNHPVLLNEFTEFLKPRGIYNYLTFFLNAQAFATSFSEAVDGISAIHTPPDIEFEVQNQYLEPDARSVSFPVSREALAVLSAPETASLPGVLISNCLTNAALKPLSDMVASNAGALFESYLSPQASSSQRLKIKEDLVHATFRNIQEAVEYLRSLENENVDILQTVKTDLFAEVKKEVCRKLERKALHEFREFLSDRIVLERASGPRFYFGSGDSFYQDDIGENEGNLETADKAASCQSLSVTLSHVLNSQLSAKIVDANKVLTNAESYVVYVIRVSRLAYKPSFHCEEDDLHGRVDGQTWNTTRRYKDFAELNNIIKARFPVLTTRIPFPKKLIFNNLADDVIKKRMFNLGEFLASLLVECTAPRFLDKESSESLKFVIFFFLQAGPWDRCGDINSLSTPVAGGSNLPVDNPSSNKLLTGAKRIGQVFTAIKTIPNRVDKTVDKLMSFMEEPVPMPGMDPGAPPRLSSDRTSVYKLVLDEVGVQSDEAVNSGIVNSMGFGVNSVATDPSLNIPMRILLRLTHEIFDLRSPRHDYMRTQFAGILSRIVVSTYGTSLNKKIVKQVNWLTSRDQVVSYIKSFRDLMWPNGKVAANSLKYSIDKGIKNDTPQTGRHPHSQMCARVICKTRMMGTVPDEIPAVLGAETTRDAMVELFELFQHPTLNRRLVIVVFEGLLRRLYPQICFDEVFRRMHQSANEKFLR